MELRRVGYSILHFQTKSRNHIARSSCTETLLFLGRWRRAAAQSKAFSGRYDHIQGFWITLKGLDKRSDQSSTLGAPKKSGCLNYCRTSYRKSSKITKMNPNLNIFCRKSYSNLKHPDFFELRESNFDRTVCQGL